MHCIRFGLDRIVLRKDNIMKKLLIDIVDYAVMALIVAIVLFLAIYGGKI